MSLREDLKYAEETRGRNYGGPLQDAVANEKDVGHLGLSAAGRSMNGATQGQVLDEGVFARRLLESERDLHREMADDLQTLLDALPAKLPERAAYALQRILSRKY